MYVCGVSRSPHPPSAFDRYILHTYADSAASRLGSQMSDPCIAEHHPIREHALSATPGILFAWAQTVVACTRFEEGILRYFCCSCLYSLVCCAACLPYMALYRSIFGRHVHKGDSAEKTTLCLKGRLCNARKQAVRGWPTESAVKQLSPDPCTCSIYIHPG